MSTIIVVRHGETTWNREKRLQGWAPARLTPVGVVQADQLGSALARTYDIDRMLSSDLARTKETVERLRDYIDVPITFSTAWRERDVGVHQGLSYNEISVRFPTFDVEQTGVDAAQLRPESGESLVDLRKRVIEGWRATLAHCEPNETLLIVTHGGPIRLLLGHIKDQNIVDAILGHSQENCAINEFVTDDTTGVVNIIRENETARC